MTTEQRRALFAHQTDKIGIDLVEISAEGMDTVYLCRNTEVITSNLNAYIPSSMEVSKPVKGSSSQKATLRISGVDTEKLEMVQSLSPDAEVTVKNMFIFADAPNDYVDGPYSYTVDTASIESATGTIELSLSVESPLDYLASQYRYDTKGFPAIWT